MEVIKRANKKETFDTEKIHERLNSLANMKNVPKLSIDMKDLVSKVCASACNDITTARIDDLCADVCVSKYTDHPDYGYMALRLTVNNLHKQTIISFSEKMILLYDNDKISSEFHRKVIKHGKELDKIIDYQNDYHMTYFGIKTLMKSYLCRLDEVLIERPQDMFMRVSLFLHDDIEKVITTYKYMSRGYLTHARSTMINSGSHTPLLSSSFSLNMLDDNIMGIYETFKRCAQILIFSSEIGINIHKIRATGSRIHSINGYSNGIIPMLKILDDTANFVCQGTNNDSGSIAVYLEPWHADIFEYLDLRKTTGMDELRTKNLCLGLWIPDLFMERVESDGYWSLFCPNEACIEIGENEKITDAVKRIEKEPKEGSDEFSAKVEASGNLYSESSAVIKKSASENIKKGTFDLLCKKAKICNDYEENANDENENTNQVNKTNRKHSKTRTTSTINLSDVYGEEFKILYKHFESSNIVRKKIKAQSLWKAIIEAQIETGNPYMLYKDACNTKNNQKNLGVLKGSNLCTEILEFTSKDEVAVCNLASIGLPMFIKEIKSKENKQSIFDKAFNDNSYNVHGKSFFFDYEALAKVAGVITENLNNIIDANYYPIKEAENSNKKHRPIGIGVQGLADVFAILRLPFESDEAKKINKRIFETIYYGAVNKSIDLAKEKSSYETYKNSPTSEGKLQFDLWNHTDLCYDWTETRKRLSEYGLRNSLMIAPMPTASTSQILGFNECFEPFTSNIYSRRTLAGNFQMVNKYMLEDLVRLNLWTPEIKNIIIEHEGSIQRIDEIPANIKAIYKTAWEISMKCVIDMAADRGPFIDQSQSLNLFVAAPTYSKLTSMHFYGWKKGLKTGMYYLRTKPIGSTDKFTVDKESVKARIEGSIQKSEDTS